MLTRSRLIAALLVTGAVLVGSMTPAAARNDAHPGHPRVTASSTPVTKRVQMLGVVEARRGKLVKQGDAFRLVLEGVAKRQLWFTDRPARLAGTDSITTLHQELFANQTPPNAALEIAAADDDHDVLLLEISNPQYDAKRHRATYDAKGLDATAPSVALSRFGARADKVVPTTFRDATLFIDSAPLETACPASLAGAGYIVSLNNIDCATAQVVLNECNLDNCNVETATNLPQGVWYGQFDGDQAWYAEPGDTVSFYWLAACRVDGTDTGYCG